MPRQEHHLTLNRLYFLGCYAFISIGISASIIGPSLPTLAQNAQTTLEQSGYVFTAMSAGYLLSAPLIHWLRTRITTRALLFSSPWLVVASMILFAFGRSFAVQMLAAMLLGLGQSGTQVSFSVLFGSGPDSSSMLNRLNAFFGIGALTGPLIASLGYTWFGAATLAFGCAVFMVLPLPIGALIWRGNAGTGRATAHTEAHGNGNISPWRTLPFWFMLGIMAIYVGTEISFSGWATEFARRQANVDVARAATSVSLFFVGMGLSRYSMSLFTRRITPLTYVGGLLVLTTLALIVMMFSNQMIIMLVCAFVAGFGFGPVYPTLIAVGIQRFPQHATLIASGLTSSGSVGALILPPLTGFLLSDQPTNGWLLLVGMMVIVLGGWAMLHRQVATPRLA